MIHQTTFSEIVTNADAYRWTQFIFAKTDQPLTAEAPVYVADEEDCDDGCTVSLPAEPEHDGYEPWAPMEILKSVIMNWTLQGGDMEPEAILNALEHYLEYDAFKPVGFV